MPSKNYLLQAWAGIVKGDLPHEQEHYSCGTSMCLAGWACELERRDHGVAIDGEPLDYKVDLYGLEVAEVLGGLAGPWYYCEEKYALGKQNATVLFFADAQLSEQYAVLTELYGADNVEPLSA